MPCVLARKTCLLWILAALVCSASAADDVRPVQIQIQEQEPGTFLVQWQVPQVLPPQAMPAPVLPTNCRPDGEASVRVQNASWLNRQRYRCADGLAGLPVRVDFPFGNPSLSTILRVELLSGERYAHMLAPGETRWEVPTDASSDAPLRAARRGVIAGASHALDHWAHFALVGAVALLGSATLIGVFTLGQLAALGVSALIGIELDPTLAELGLILAVVLLLREALRPSDERRQVESLTMVSGVVHGFGLAALGAQLEIGVAQTALMALGMDVTLLAFAAGGLLLLNRYPRRRALAYGLGAGAVAIGLGLITSDPMSAEAPRLVASRLPALASATSTGPGSSRIAPRTPDAPVQSFVAIEAFEVRQEILIRLADIADSLGLERNGVLELDEQAPVKDRIKSLGLSGSAIAIDGEPREAREARVDFMTVNAAGVLPRPRPVRETVADAYVGFSVSYLTKSTPREVTLSWESFLEEAPIIPSTMIDPETTRSALLALDAPTMTWTNELSEDPVPTVEAVSVEPAMLPIPTLSLPLVLLAAVFAYAAIRGTRVTLSSGLSRMALALAMLAAPVGNVAIALPTATADSPEAARRILAGILPNVYRAFEFRDESQAYDRLAVSVTGDTLTDVYLEHQRALEMEERGGARASVEAVEVGDVSAVEPQDDGGFEALASWQVGGTVTHFGHRHFRQNRYDARVRVVPVDDLWKIRTIEVLQEERVR